jgi:hypothetical protein
MEKAMPRAGHVWIMEMNANEPLMKCRESATFCHKCLKYAKHYKPGGHLFIGWAAGVI